MRDWVRRYPRKSLVTQATYDKTYRVWDVKVWSGPAGEIAAGRVDDLGAVVTEAWTGPQVAWRMARGGAGAFGGKKINSLTVWLTLCAVFLAGLADLRRPFSLRNLDLIALLSFSVSLWYFNHGRIFVSVPLVYPGLAYLLGRTIWIGVRDRPPPASRPLWPVWVLAAATVFLGGFKVGLNVRDSNVIDVGYAGVDRCGADRTRPVAVRELSRRGLDEAVRVGRSRRRDPRANPGERPLRVGEPATATRTGPSRTSPICPATRSSAGAGSGTTCPPSHFTAIAFDLLCMVGLGLAGRRFGGNRLGVTLAFAWAAYPFTQYVSNSNTNDAIMPAFLIWGFWLATSRGRAACSPRSRGWTKFARAARRADLGDLPGVSAQPADGPATSPAASRSRRVASFWVLLLEPNPLHAARVFWDRTIPTQVNRHSPFSLWDWRQYHAGPARSRVAPEGAPGRCSSSVRSQSHSSRAASRRSSWRR